MKVDQERRDKLIEVLSEVLNRLCERNDRFIMNTTPITRFHALRPPQITVKYYLQRIAKYSNCSEECFVLSLIYIDRLIRTNGNFLVNSLNVHRLLITSMMLAAKFFDDQYFNNAYYGKVGGVSCKEINLLEIEFLFMINFNLYVEADTYRTYNERLMMHPPAETHETTSTKPKTSEDNPAPVAQQNSKASDGATPAPSAPTNTSAPMTHTNTGTSSASVPNPTSQNPAPAPVAPVAPSRTGNNEREAPTRTNPTPVVPVRARRCPAQRCTPPSQSPKFVHQNRTNLKSY